MLVLESKILLKVQRGESAVEKIGGMVVPVGAGQYSVGEVVSVGPKVEGDVEEGDTIYYYPNAGKELTINGESYRVISSAEVLVVL